MIIYFIGTALLTWIITGFIPFKAQELVIILICSLCNKGGVNL